MIKKSGTFIKLALLNLWKGAIQIYLIDWLIHSFINLSIFYSKGATGFAGTGVNLKAKKEGAVMTA